MQPSDSARFQQLLTAVMSYYRQDTSDFALSLFWSALASFDFEDVKRAFQLHAQDPDRGQFAPRVADITRALEGTTQSQAALAWSKVERATRCVGAYQTVVFDDPLIHAVIVDMGGWITLCQSSVEDMPYRARDFEKRYQGYRVKREVPEYLPRLAGIAESENANRGQKVPNPVLIGHPEKAKEVLRLGSSQGPLRITSMGDLARKVLPEKL